LQRSVQELSADRMTAMCDAPPTGCGPDTAR